MNLREALDHIYEIHGKLTPEIILEEARPVDHPLHERFDWDDTTAAESWRRQQAHELIRSVRIKYRPEDKPADTVRAFHAVRDEFGYAYHSAEKIVADPFLSRLVLADMEREWRQLKSRYEQFDEFVEMVRRDVA